jgi:hypothetical protein
MMGVHETFVLSRLSVVACGPSHGDRDGLNLGLIIVNTSLDTAVHVGLILSD